MSRDYAAKRLAKELDIPYAEALRRARAGATVEAPPVQNPETDANDPATKD